MKSEFQGKIVQKVLKNGVDAIVKAKVMFAATRPYSDETKYQRRVNPSDKTSTEIIIIDMTSGPNNETPNDCASDTNGPYIARQFLKGNNPFA